MPEPIRIDPERLAALIDGRLGPADAAEVRGQLAQADADTLAAYADAVALAAELRGEVATSNESGAIGRASSAASRRWLTPALAALAAGVIAVAVLRVSGGRSSGLDVATPAAGPLEVPAWRSVRSSDAPATERGRAVRVGVLLVQYELAARRADTAAASRAALIAELLEGVPGGSAAAARWRTAATGAQTASEGVRDDDAQVARALVDPDFAALGVWLESARTAAAANQRGWFDANGVAPLTRAAGMAALSPAERETIREVERLATARPLDLPALATAIAAAERELGR